MIALVVRDVRRAYASGGATLVVAFFLLAAAGLAWCAWSLWKVRRWARGPVVMAQLIQLGLAWNFRDVGGLVLPLSLAFVALLVIVGLLHPSTTEVLEEDARL